MSSNFSLTLPKLYMQPISDVSHQPNQRFTSVPPSFSESWPALFRT
jgi:hypothetical protein